ncbi:MAG: hypothetical protein IPG33_14615 [Betaproteobacteria bacterium]|nr:hypothetical protein [Betaproteobacteria bacterium]
MSKALDALLFKFSVFGIPIAIGVLTLTALFAWESQYSVGNGIPIEFRVLEQKVSTLTHEVAQEKLSKTSAVRHFDTRLSENPFWFSFVVPSSGEGQAPVIEFPSRHATSISCWNPAGLEPLGEASRGQTIGSIKEAKAGFVLELGPQKTDNAVVCQATYSRASADFNRAMAGSPTSGIVTTGSAQCGIARWRRNRALSFRADNGDHQSGMDVRDVCRLAGGKSSCCCAFHGVGHAMARKEVPPEWMVSMRKLSMATYYVLTYTLFTRLFRDDLKRVGHERLLRAAQWSCLPLLLFAVVLPYQQFLPYLWLTTAFGIGVLAFFLFRILFSMRSKVAMWYSASLGIALFASLYEVIAAALGVKVLIGTINSVTAALSSSLLAAFAIAEQMRQEREDRVSAQTALRNT